MPRGTICSMMCRSKRRSGPRKSSSRWGSREGSQLSELPWHLGMVDPTHQRNPPVVVDSAKDLQRLGSEREGSFSRLDGLRQEGAFQLRHRYSAPPLLPVARVLW